jgi:hypothetical protein
MRRAALLTALVAIGCAPAESTGGSGGDDPPAPCEHPRPQGNAVPFVDVTAASGVDFVHHPPAMCDMLDTVGGPGVCAFDADGDGDMDLYFADRAPYPNRLYRNDGGTFTDITEESGAGLTDDSHSCLAFDADGDGDLDLFVGNSGPDRLLRNDGGTFTDVTQESGLVEDGFTNTATAGDVDGDGDLDLFVGHFVVPDTCPGPYCAPSPASCEALPNALYINEGGVFHDEAAARGLTHVEPTLASLFFDFDFDGDLDLYVGNDIGAKNPDRFYRNDGTGMFVEDGKSTGIDMRGTDTMGVDVGDIDGDGTLDLVTSDFRLSPIRMLLCPDPSAPCEMIGINEESVEGVKWSIALVDVDHDTDLDIFTVSGNVSVPKGYPGDLPQLHKNNGKGRFTLYHAGPEEALGQRRLARGAAFVDLDGDLDIDVVVANANGPAQVLRNEGASGYGLLVELDTLSAGARVTVKGTGVARTEQALIGGSYAGSSDPRVHFGLGGACEVDVTVEWPGGASRTVQGVRSGQQIRVDRTP